MPVPVDGFEFGGGWFHCFAAAGSLVLVWWVVSLAAAGFKTLSLPALDLAGVRFKQHQVRCLDAAGPTNATDTTELKAAKPNVEKAVGSSSAISGRGDR